ncbi:hypothetical protein [Vibrio fluvialis]
MVKNQVRQTPGLNQVSHAMAILRLRKNSLKARNQNSATVRVRAKRVSRTQGRRKRTSQDATTMAMARHALAKLQTPIVNSIQGQKQKRQIVTIWRFAIQGSG